MSKIVFGCYLADNVGAPPFEQILIRHTCIQGLFVCNISAISLEEKILKGLVNRNQIAF